MFVLAVSLPVSARAEMSAYLDAKGVVYYRNIREPDHRIRFVINARSNPIPTRGYVAYKGYGNDSCKNCNRVESEKLDRYIRKAAMVYGVDPLLVRAVIEAESNFNAHAISPKGAQGLIQLMPGTARDLQVADPFDPGQNINGGTRYLRSLLDSFGGNVQLSLAAYNAGPKQVEASRGLPPFLETRNYIVRVLQNYRSYTR